MNICIHMYICIHILNNQIYTKICILTFQSVISISTHLQTLKTSLDSCVTIVVWRAYFHPVFVCLGRLSASQFRGHGPEYWPASWGGRPDITAGQHSNALIWSYVGCSNTSIFRREAPFTNYFVRPSVRIHVCYISRTLFSLLVDLHKKSVKTLPY